MKIITNNHWRQFVYGYELPVNELDQFNWMDNPEDSVFIKYDRDIIPLESFLKIQITDSDSIFNNWQAVWTYSYFSGLLIRISKDNEAYQIARFYQ